MSFVRVPPFPMMVETRSDRCFHIYNRTRALLQSSLGLMSGVGGSWEALSSPQLVMPRGRQYGGEQGVGEGNVDDCSRDGPVVLVVEG